MRTIGEIEKLLAQLDQITAGDLESQDLEFKQWIDKSMRDSVSMVVDAAVCMANGGGGTVVLGVSDNAKGRQKAIVGIPNEVDANLLKKAVYDKTDPKITPVFETQRARRHGQAFDNAYLFRDPSLYGYSGQRHS